MHDSNRPVTPRRTRTLRIGLGVTAVTVTAAHLLRHARKPTSDVVLDATLRLLQSVLPAQRSLTVQLWNGTTLPATQPEVARLILNNPTSLGRMLHLPLDMAMGEAYLRGDYDLQGDISSIAGLADTFDATFTPTTLLRILRDADLLRRHAGRAPTPPSARLEGPPHSQERDRQAIEYPYYVSTDFNKLWLDQRMIYSCAYFPRGDETLDEAQEAKLELI